MNANEDYRSGAGDEPRLLFDISTSGANAEEYNQLYEAPILSGGTPDTPWLVNWPTPVVEMGQPQTSTDTLDKILRDSPCKEWSENLLTLPLVAIQEHDAVLSVIQMSSNSMPRLSYLDQRRLFSEAGYLPCKYPSRLIPQDIYIPSTERDRIQYIDNAEWLRPIYFKFIRGWTFGIPVIDILTGHLEGLEDPTNKNVLKGARPSISIRVSFPGYVHWSKQVSSMDFCTDRSYISRRKVAEVVAKKLQEFFQAVEEGKVRKEVLTSGGSASQWEIGPGGVQLGNVILVALHHVSQGSFQPVLRLR